MGRGLNKNIAVTSQIEGWMREELQSTTLTTKKSRGVSLVVMNALAGSGEYITYLRCDAKVEDKRYNKWQISNRTMKWCVDYVSDRGWVESVIGHATPIEENQTPSMFKATKALLDLFPKSEIEYVKKLYRESIETIVLRDSNKECIGYRDNTERKQMRTVVKKLNIVNEGHVFMHNGEVLNNSNMVRIFNETFEQGGRFYRADAQLIKQRDNQGLSLPPHMQRVGMTIDCVPVVEVDFSCLHPMIVCAKYNILEEKYLARDFYSTFLDDKSVGADRQLFKVAVNIMFNSTSTQSAAQAINKRVIEKARKDNNREDVYTWKSGKAVVEKVFSMMPDMADFFCNENSYGKTLQYIDSCIAERVIERFIAEDEPIVPIHDSFIVKHTSEARLCKAMEDAFRHTTGNNDIMVTLKINRYTGEEKVMLC